MMFPILKDMNAMEIRKFMTEKGWHSKDRLSSLGWGNKFGYSIWFSRWDWHGKKTATIIGGDVTFHEHTDNLSNIGETVRKCAYKALKAYEDFPTSIPYQNVKGEKVEEKNLPYTWEEGLPVESE